jgi:hypothetical protein
VTNWRHPFNIPMTGHSVRRPSIEVDCPQCNVTLDVESRKWITCPDCEITFNRHTGEILPAKGDDS